MPCASPEEEEGGGGGCGGMRCEVGSAGDAEKEKETEKVDCEGTLSKNQKRKLNRLQSREEYRLKRRLRHRQKRKQRAARVGTPVEEEEYNEDGAGVGNGKQLGVGLGQRAVEGTVRKKNEDKAAVVERLKAARHCAPHICIDLNWDGCMSERERSQLSDHLQRLYGSNKKSPSPLHVSLCNFSPQNPIYSTCTSKHHGFLNYVFDFHPLPLLKVFDVSQIVYLTPDSPNVLQSLDSDRVYVLGGLVDLSVRKNETVEFANSHAIETASLPILKYMHKDTSQSRHSFKRILSVNQVFDILLKFHETHCWTTALSHGMPKRHGYLPIEAAPSQSSPSDKA